MRQGISLGLYAAKCVRVSYEGLTYIRARILCEPMNAIRHIRKNVFGVTQHEFAAIAGVQQASVSRWENGGAPTLEEMQRIRAAASEPGRKLKRKWRDDLFFTVPTEGQAA